MGNARSRILSYPDKPALSDSEFFELRRVLQVKDKAPLMRSGFRRTASDQNAYESFSKGQIKTLKKKLKEEAARRSAGK